MGVSETIFKNDPLLVQADNQKGYGDEILKNLLVVRPASSGDAVAIDLHADDRDEALARPKNKKIDVTAKDRDDFEESLVQRKAMPDEKRRTELEQVSMVARGEETKLRRLRTTDGDDQHNFVSRTVADGEADPDQPNRRLRVAAVGFRVKISKLEKKGQLGEDLSVLPQLKEGTIKGLPDSQELRQLSRTGNVPSAAIAKWKKTIVGQVQTAIDNGSQIVVLPEFALPPATKKDEILKEIRKASEASAKTNVHGKKADHFIFAGSRHEGGYNRGLVLHLKDEELSKTFWHYKVASARGLGENILGPNNANLPNYIFEAPLEGMSVNLTLVIAICFDAFDPSMFLSLVWNSIKYNRINRAKGQMILVPSFNPSPKFVEMLRDLSFLAQCPVLYVNSLHGDARMFISGFAVGDLMRIKGAGVGTEIEKAIDKVKEKITEDNEAQEQKKAAGAERTDSERNRTHRLDETLRNLNRIQKKVQELDLAKSFENLITVEDCDICSSDAGHGKDTYGCSRDILYYNLDWELLRALTEFRSFFHGLEDSFLPKPLQENELRAYFKELKDKKDARAQKLAASSGTKKPGKKAKKA